MTATNIEAVARVVYTRASDTHDVQGTLFEGMKFWLAQKVPQRSLFVEQVRANGGEVVPLEQHADVKIVDHMRKEVFPGTYSWRYIRESIRNGALEDLEGYQVGPPAGTVRSVGSSVQPPRGKRISFTADDDRALWNWVEAARLKGGKVRGNELYKQLEQVNPRHTYQAWRDRWIQHLEGRPRPIAVSQHCPPTFPTNQPSSHRERSEIKRQPPEPTEDDEFSMVFSKDDEEFLLAHGEDICKVLPDNEMEAWQGWAQKFPKASAEQWQDLWEEKVRPLYHRERKRNAVVTGSATTSKLQQDSKPSGGASLATRILSADTNTPNPSNKHVRQTTRSPSYHPESPKLNLPELSLTESRSSNIVTPARNITEHMNVIVVEGQDTYQSPKPDIHGSSKRKRDDYEADAAHSSPIEALQSPYRNRQRRRSMQELMEIPSTPDRSPIRGTVLSEVPEPRRSRDKNLSVDREVKKQSQAAMREPLQPGDQRSQTTSEPDQFSRDTQAAFRDPTQYIDLSLPPPEDGWDDEESVDEELATDPTKDLPDRSTIPDTQALLESNTQIPDFNLPTPDHDGPPSPPDVHESSQTRTTENDNDTTESQINAELDAWIDEMGAAGYSDEDVEMALKCTTMNTNLAETVLEYFASHQALPRRMRGVWTEEDDKVLDFETDARRIEGLESKHGKEALGARFDFLEAYKSPD